MKSSPFIAASLPRHAVKICGLRTAEHAVAAAVAGADLIGFIFAPSRRNVLPETARAAVAAARAAAPGPILAVGVFVNATASEMNQVADIVGLDVVQLSGDEPDTVMDQIERPILRALRPRPGARPLDVIPPLTGGVEPRVLAYLIDGYHPGAYGGTGVRADWSLAAEVARSVSVVLAGGLNPENVADGIATVMPFGVDVGSGVERDGVKDAALIQAFVSAAKLGFSSSNTQE